MSLLSSSPGRLELGEAQALHNLLFMKILALIFPLVLSPAAFAGGWLFSATDTAAPARAAAAHPAPPRRPVAVTPQSKPAPVTTNNVRKCSVNFNEAIKLVKAVHGADADLSRMGQFNGSFSTYTSENQFKKSGGSILLNMTIGGMISTDVPVTICRNDGKITVTILTSKAREAGTAQPNQIIQQKVASRDIPGSIVLKVARSGRTLSFAGVANGTQLQATAALR